MEYFNIKNIGIISTFDLKNNKRFILGWSIAIFSIMFMYMILFPSVKDMAQIKIDSMSKELLQFVGMGELSQLDNFINYFGMVYNLILVAISIFSAVFSANLIYKEEKTKSIEFLNSLSVSRVEIYLSKLLTSYIGVILVLMSGIISSLICGFINGGETFIIADFIKIAKVSSFTAVFFISTSLLITGLTTKINTAAVGSFIVLITYILGFLGELLEDKGEWLLYLSPFKLFSPQNAVELSSDTMMQLGIYFIISIVLIIVGAIAYKKRDFS